MRLLLTCWYVVFGWFPVLPPLTNLVTQWISKECPVRGASPCLVLFHSRFFPRKAIPHNLPFPPIIDRYTSPANSPFSGITVLEECLEVSRPLSFLTNFFCPGPILRAPGLTTHILPFLRGPRLFSLRPWTTGLYRLKDFPDGCVRSSQLCLHAIRRRAESKP